MPASLCSSLCHFPECRTVCIVINVNRKRKVFFQFFCKRHMLPADVVGIQHNALFAVNRARASGSCAKAVRNAVTVFFQQLSGCLSHIFHHLLPWPPGVCRYGCLRQYFIRSADNSYFNAGSPKVNPDNYLFLFIHRQFPLSISPSSVRETVS